MSLKSAVKPWLRPLPQWAAIGLVPPQQAVSATLEWGQHSEDVTRNHTIASLRPLSVAIGLSDAIDPTHATLVYRDRSSGDELGKLVLSRSFARSAAGKPIGVFDVKEAHHHCLSWPQRPWNAWLQARAMRRNTNPHNFQMAPKAVQQLMTFYIRPRPVVLVSICEESHSNIFPMDLIGPLANNCFTLALRSTSISVPTMVGAGRIVLSGVPAELKDVTYKLGEHHKRGFAHWESLPFPVVWSEIFGIPAMASALWVRELQVLHSEQIGSHTFFACETISEYQRMVGPQLHHTSGFHQEFRRRRGAPFPIA